MKKIITLALDLVINLEIRRFYEKDIFLFIAILTQ